MSDGTTRAVTFAGHGIASQDETEDNSTQIDVQLPGSCDSEILIAETEIFDTLPTIDSTIYFTSCAFDPADSTLDFTIAWKIGSTIATSVGSEADCPKQVVLDFNIE